MKIIFEKPELFHNFDEQAELIEKLLDIGTALSGTQELSSLLNLILTKSRGAQPRDVQSIKFPLPLRVSVARVG